MSVKSMQPPHLFLEKVCAPFAKFDSKRVVCQSKVNFQFTRDYQCGLAASVQHSSSISVSVSVYYNFMYKQTVNSKKFNCLINIA